jgi:hypothetical protein
MRFLMERTRLTLQDHVITKHAGEGEGSISTANEAATQEQQAQERHLLFFPPKERSQ